MLEAIRKRAGSLVVKILFLFLVLSFGIWGIADVFRPGRGTEWAAEVGDVKISTASLQEEYRETLRRLSQAIGGSMDADQARALGLPPSVLNHMIEGALYDRAAADAGIIVTDAVVRQEIKADPHFRNQSGEFDPAIFREALQRNGFTEDRYVGLLRRELQREQLLGSLAGGVVPPQSLVDAVLKYRGERRVADYAVVPTPTSGIPDADEPTLRQFYQDHSALFTAPEYRSVSMVVLSADDVAKSVSISDADLHAAYEDRTAEFTRPERRTFRQIVLADEAAAQGARARLAQGGDFSGAATQAGARAENIGPVQREQLPVELASAVFDLPVGVVSTPIRTSLGWHLIDVTAVEPGGIQTFDEAKERLASELKRAKALDQLVDLGNKLEDTLGRGATLQEAAAELNLPLRKIDSIDARGQDAVGASVPDLPPKAVETAFVTAQGAQSSLIEAGNDTYFAVQVDAITPSAVTPFEAVRKRVEEAWLAQERSDRAKKAADALAERLRSGGDIQAAAAERQLKAATTPPFTRTGEGAPPDLSRAAIAQLFDVKPGETAVIPLDGGFAVARLNSVLPPADDADRSAEAGIRTELTESLRGDILAQFAAGLRNRYSVKINPHALEQL
jgi:peptidyl-prolyl cis-trans isomerase D